MLLYKDCSMCILLLSLHCYPLQGIFIVQLVAEPVFFALKIRSSLYWTLDLHWRGYLAHILTTKLSHLHLQNSPGYTQNDHVTIL